jgi:hypothetical protein
LRQQENQSLSLENGFMTRHHHQLFDHSRSSERTKTKKRRRCLRPSSKPQK